MYSIIIIPVRQVFNLNTYKTKNILENMESLILAQDERWRYALHMQVERKLSFSSKRVSNT